MVAPAAGGGGGEPPKLLDGPPTLETDDALELLPYELMADSKSLPDMA